MCGRFTQAYTWTEIHAFLDVIGPARNLRARYNIAPTTTIDVVRPSFSKSDTSDFLSDTGRELVRMRWGLAPSWWKKTLKELPSTFNARAESVAEKSMFRSAFKSRRCVIPASGYYEWTGKSGAKTPHYFSSTFGEPLLFAGLWESWRDPEQDRKIESATIIVGPANEFLAGFHDRAPVMIARDDVDAWMTGEDPCSLLRPAPPGAVQEWVVSPRVNRTGVGDDDPSLIEAVIAVKTSSSQGAQPR
ncbi:SOS response-associated peptidase [Methylocystis sp. IM4]|uniref:SOS response-associated peptidase n=1 Tax=Methylocystis sp. IM4 TaxID=3136560 RepID=UPI003119EE89